MSINTKTINIWGEQAKKICEEKKINVGKLKSKFDYIYFAWDEKYDYHRKYYSERIQQFPLFIIDVINDKQIRQILDYIYKKKLTIRICGGRHSSQLVSPEVLVDISRIDYIKINKNILTVGGGATQGASNDFLYNYSKKNNVSFHYNFGHFTHGKSSQFPGGSAVSVGISGISGAGGIGNLRRKYGMTIDSIRSITLTLPPNLSHKAKTIQITNSPNDKYSDLFWAICGGGANNFGIISEIKYELYEVDDVIQYDIVFEPSQTQKIINLWATNALNLPDEFTEELALGSTFGSKSLSISGFYVVKKTQTKEEAENYVLSKLSYLGGKISIKYDNYENIYEQVVKNRTFDNFSATQTIFTNTIPSDLLINAINSSVKLNSNTSIEIELLGGKFKSNSTGSFSFRDANYFIVITSKWDNLQDSQPNQSWLNEYYKLLVPKALGVYLGFPITFTNIPHTNQIYYPASYDKLKKIKSKSDPDNVLTPTGTL
jgi:FAD/FMN-containing dehydrogenase